MTDPEDIDLDLDLEVEVGPVHEHPALYVAESLVNSRVCVLCGAYINSARLDVHSALHDALEALGVGVPLEDDGHVQGVLPFDV